MKRLLCPVDFSDASSHAIMLAGLVARYYKASLTAVHVLTPSTMDAFGAVTSAEEAREIDRVRGLVREEVAEAAEGLCFRVLVDIGQPAHAILERASKLPADLIVIGTHGTSGFQHLVLGSVTEKVLRRAACPVLTVPPRAHATSQLPFRRLLCAVDFSDASLDAVRSAVSLADESGAALTLLHVLEWPW